MAILFYKAHEVPYGILSNFSLHGFHLDGEWWTTVEHYYQAAKFLDAEIRKSIRLASTPEIAWRLGNDRTHCIRANWSSIRLDIMKNALRAKYSANFDARKAPLDTGDEELIENTRGDRYWGRGREGDGKNMLGLLLMELRELTRAESVGLD